MSLKIDSSFQKESLQKTAADSSAQAVKEKAAAESQAVSGQNEGFPIPKDEYISSEKSGDRPSGLYRLGQDENGNPKVLFDDPKKTDCTTNTDHVDREIEKLKEEKKLLERQISAASDGEEKKELERKLALTEQELSQKDNDSYRRANADIS